MFKNKDRAVVEDRPRQTGRALALTAAALIAAGPVLETRGAYAQTAPAPGFTYDPVQNGRERVLSRFGDAPFAGSLEQALDATHLGQIFNAAVQEGTLQQSDRAAFFAAAEAQRGQAGTTQEIQPGTVVPWMTYREGRIAAAGPDRLRLAMTQAAGARTFEVARQDGSVVTFGIIVRTVDGIPCFNVAPIHVTPPLSVVVQNRVVQTVVQEERVFVQTDEEEGFWCTRNLLNGLICVGGIALLVYGISEMNDDDDDCCDPGDNRHPGDRRPWGDGDEVIESDPWN